jgi:hypothetical protein
VLGDNIPQLPYPGHIGVVLPAPPYHMRCCAVNFASSALIEAMSLRTSRPLM